MIKNLIGSVNHPCPHIKGLEMVIAEGDYSPFFFIIMHDFMGFSCLKLTREGQP